MLLGPLGTTHGGHEGFQLGPLTWCKESEVEGRECLHRDQFQGCRSQIIFQGQAYYCASSAPPSVQFAYLGAPLGPSKCQIYPVFCQNPWERHVWAGATH